MNNRTLREKPQSTSLLYACTPRPQYNIPSFYLSADEEKEKKSQTVIFVMALYPLLSLRISLNPEINTGRTVNKSLITLLIFRFFPNHTQFGLLKLFLAEKNYACNMFLDLIIFL
jgi:hypothetical protein